MSADAAATAAPSAWSERLLLRSGLSPVQAGLALAVALLATFVVTELLLGRHRLLMAQPDPLASLRDTRLTLLQCGLAAYLPAAYTALLRTSRQTLGELRPLLRGLSNDLTALERQVGRYPSLSPFVASGAGLLLVAWSIFLTTPSEFMREAWTWSELSPEVRWHRVLGVWIGWWLGRLVWAVVAESRRLSDAAPLLREVDLLDPVQTHPFVRQSLTNALLVVGIGSIMTLFLIENYFLGLVAQAWALSGFFSGAAVWLPLRGVHRRIREAKERELSWCRAALRDARAALGRGERSETPLDELVAWESRIAAVREWPFDASSLSRLALYLMIPLGSWSGGALVERLIDSLLD